MKPYKLRIEGVKPEDSKLIKIKASGFKHSAILLLAASPLFPSPIRIENIPHITDVTGLIDCLHFLGCRTELKDNVLTIDNEGFNEYELPALLTENLHGPLYLLPAILSRMGRAKVGPLGGCQIGEPSVGGRRPTTHVLDVLRLFGATAEEANGVLSISTPNTNLRNTTIDVLTWSTDQNYARGPLVSGVTKTAILAALGVRTGRTIIFNPYLRKETVELLNVCNKAGWIIEVKPGYVSIEAPRKNFSQLASIKLTSDFIEIITYTAFAVLTNRKAEFSVTHSTEVKAGLAAEFKILKKMGVEITNDEQTLTIIPHAPHYPFELEAGLPGIYSDNQPFFALMASTCQGSSVIRDFVWKNRFSYIDGLKTLGINVTPYEEKSNVVVQQSSMSSNEVTVTGRDLRAAAVLAVAAAARPGVTILEGGHILERGYEDTIGKFRSCGVGIEILSGENT